MQSQTPQGPWYNPQLEETVYDAIIKHVQERKYRNGEAIYIQFLFWLPKAKEHVVTNIYFSEDKSGERSLKRLTRLCQCVGRFPEEARDNPRGFENAKLQITIKRLKGIKQNGGNPYCDVDMFLPAGTVKNKD